MKTHYEKVTELIKDIILWDKLGIEKLNLNNRYLQHFDLTLDDLTIEDYQRIAQYESYKEN